MKILKIILLNYLLIGFLLVMIITNVSAETTFFENPTDALIINDPSAPESNDETTATIGTDNGGSGGGGSCTTPWTCTNWSICKFNIQTRKCTYPSGWCTPITSKPVQAQTCASSPEPLTTPEILLKVKPANPEAMFGITGGVVKETAKEIEERINWRLAGPGFGIAFLILILNIAFLKKKHKKEKERMRLEYGYSSRYG